MNTKKLYQADGYAVKELLKVTSILYNAVKTSVTNYKDPSDESDGQITFDISSKVSPISSSFLTCLKMGYAGSTFLFA